MNFPFLGGRCELTETIEFPHTACRGQDDMLTNPGIARKEVNGEKEEREEEVRRNFLK